MVAADNGWASDALGRDVAEFLLMEVSNGVVTIMVLTSEVEHSMEKPWGRKVLNPSINFGCPLNKDETLSITPGVSIL